LQRSNIGAMTTLAATDSARRHITAEVSSESSYVDNDPTLAFVRVTERNHQMPQSRQQRNKLGYTDMRNHMQSKF
jgi:hypothetical protein